ncbi:MAG: CotH kinase family protein, partial [Verrucomicrobiota bacterium]|nr:CotH kinase family protein [Verrucomicrobiota bacterium]
PAPRARAVRVLENNQPLGGADSFGHIAELDPLNSEYIRWQFPNDDNGNLYKGGGHADLKFLGNDPAPYTEKYFYAKQTKAWQNDYSDLIGFLRTLGQADGRMDANAWMRHLAVHDLLGNMETSLVTGDKGDYALFAGTVDRRFALIPYDLDGVLGVQGGAKSPLWRAAVNPALGQLMSRPAVAARYWFHLADLAQTVFAAEQLDPVIDRLVGDYLPRAEVDRLKSFAANRCEFVLSQIPDELTVATGLAKRVGFLFSESATVKLSGQAPATSTVAVEVNGLAADWFAPETRWQAKVALRPGLNRLLVRALDADGNEAARQHTDVWHGDAPVRPLGQRLTQSARWTAAQPQFVAKPLVVPAGVTLT